MTELLVMGLDKAFEPVFELVERMPEPPCKPVPCERNMMCMCERRRCPGRTLNIKTYTRRIMQS